MGKSFTLGSKYGFHGKNRFRATTQDAKGQIAKYLFKLNKTDFGTMFISFVIVSRSLLLKGVTGTTYLIFFQFFLGEFKYFTINAFVNNAR